MTTEELAKLLRDEMEAQLFKRSNEVGELLTPDWEAMAAAILERYDLVPRCRYCSKGYALRGDGKHLLIDSFNGSKKWVPCPLLAAPQKV